ncbi:MAG: type II toxin-antitoxin system RelB/DinJ family antitoxin [Selenomonadaceae bacterium]|nr:type II toxin-antitoxin system RelB/DinJ family antitoxin [Selenomonadaceae bacterium]
MAQATLSVRLDSRDKQSFENFCHDVGLNVSAAINIFVRAVIKAQRIPFVIERDPFYSEENLNRIRQSLAEVNAGRYTIHEPIEVEQ